MLAVVILGIFALILLVSLAMGFFNSQSEIKEASFAVAGLSAFLFIITTLISSFFYVQAREVGIIVSFGKATGTATTGSNWSWPWTEVTKFSTGNQPLDFDGDQDKISFKLANAEGEAWVNLNASWQITGDDTAIKLWEDRKEFDRVKNEVVLPNVKSAIVGVMGSYTAEQANDSANILKFNERLLEEVNKSMLPRGIKIEGIAVTRVDLSDVVKQKLEQKNSDKIQNDRAVIQQETARTEAETNRIKQQAATELVNQANCIEMTNNWDVNKNGPLPAGWNCFAGIPFVK